MDPPFYGAAIFSTHLGRYEPRKIVATPVVLRSDPDEDQDALVAKLQRLFPEQCKAITAPITNIYDYFDPYDAHRHGFLFLESVLGTIASHNFMRAQKVQGFAEEWMRANPGLFDAIMSKTPAIFNHTEVNTYGREFLGEAFGLLRSLRMNRPAPPHADHSAPPSVSGRRFSANNGRQRGRGNSLLSQTHTQEAFQQPPSGHAPWRPLSNRKQPASQRPGYEAPQRPEPIYFPARHDFYSNPGDDMMYSQPSAAGPFVPFPPMGYPGPSYYQYPPPNHPVVPSYAGPANPITVQNPVKAVSDDARVLEFQEAAGRRARHDSNHSEAWLRQRSENGSSGSYPGSGFHQAALSTSSGSSASDLLEKDPAVISVGLKTDHRVNQGMPLPSERPQYSRPAQEGSLMALIKGRQSSEEQNAGVETVATAKTASLAGSHDASASQPDPKGNTSDTHAALESSTHLTQGERNERQGREQNLVSRDGTDGSTTNLSSPHENSETSDASRSYPRRNYLRVQLAATHSGGKETVWVGGLYPDIDRAKLTQLLESFGEVKMISNIFTRDRETLKAFAFVTFLTEQAAIQTIKHLDHAKFENTVLKVKPARRGSGRSDTSYSSTLTEGSRESLQHCEAIKSEEKSSSIERKGKNAPDPPLRRQDEASSTTSLSKKKQKYLPKSSRQGGDAPEMSHTVSGSTFGQHHERSFSAVRNENAAINPPVTGKSTENPPTIKQEENTVTDSPATREKPDDASWTEQQSDLVFALRRESGVLESGSRIAVDASALDLSIKDSSTTSPKPMVQTDETSPTDPQADQTKNTSVSSSLTPVDISTLQPPSGSQNLRLPGKIRKRLEQRASKATKQKEAAQQDEQSQQSVISGKAKVRDQRSANYNTSNVESDTKLTSQRSVSKTIPGDGAERKTQSERNSQPEESTVESHQATSVGDINEGLQPTQATASEATTKNPSKKDPSALRPCFIDHVVAPQTLAESFNASPHQISSTSKAVDMPETSTMDDKDNLKSPRSSKPVEMDQTENPPSPQTPITTHKKKRKIVTPGKNKVTRVGDPQPSSTSPDDAEPSQEVTPKAAEGGLLLEQVDQEHVTQGTESRSGHPETMGDEKAGRICDESSFPHRADSSASSLEQLSPRKSRPSKTKAKKGRKSKRKGKAKSGKQTPETPAEVLEEASKASSYIRSLPAPETPFLVDDAHITPLVKSDEGEKSHGRITSSSTREGPSTCSREELEQYHHLKKTLYWPQLSKIIGGPSVPDPSSPIVPVREEDHDDGSLGASQPSSTVLNDVKIPDSDGKNGEARRTSTGDPADDEFTRVAPEAVARAKQVLQTCAELAHPGSSGVAEPRPGSFGSVPQYQIPAADGAESSLRDSHALAEKSAPSNANDCVSSNSPAGSMKAKHRKVQDPDGSLGCSGREPGAQSQQTSFSRVRTDSSSSERTRTADASSESSNIQSEDEATEKAARKQAATKGVGNLSFPLLDPVTSCYPCHSSEAGLGDLEDGDVVEVIPTDGGDSEVVKVVREERAWQLTDRDGVERDLVERRDYSVVPEPEVWGYAQKVWNF